MLSICLSFLLSLNWYNFKLFRECYLFNLKFQLNVASDCIEFILKIFTSIGKKTLMLHPECQWSRYVLPNIKVENRYVFYSFSQKECTNLRYISQTVNISFILYYLIVVVVLIVRSSRNAYRIFEIC